MCPPKAPKVQAPASAPAPAAQGADSLKLGGDSTIDAEELARSGILGRAALRIGGRAAGGGGSGTGSSTAAAASGVASLPAALGIGASAPGGSGGFGTTGSSSGTGGASRAGSSTGDFGLRIGRSSIDPSA